MPPTETLLSEAYVQDCFHSYLRSSLAQAKAEKLLDVELLSSAEGDLMITGPALCLYFAALRCTTNPPSVPLPRLEKHLPPLELTATNCPSTYTAFLLVWTRAVPEIQALSPEHQHDLARMICSLPPNTTTSPPNGARLAAELRAVAIEISQRRTFQTRYSGDLQAAIDSGGPSERGRGRVRASFEPPPEYEPSPSRAGSAAPSPLSPLVDLPPPSPITGQTASASQGGHRNEKPPVSPTSRPSPRLPVPALQLVTPLNIRARSPARTSAASGAASASALLPPQSPTLLSPRSAAFPSTAAPSLGAASGASSSRPRSPSPTIFAPDSPAIELIRETLYAALADVLERAPKLRRMLKTDPPRAYFGSVALAILEVATTAITREGSVVGVMGKELTLAQCPPPLQPLMRELAEIGSTARAMENEDSENAARALAADQEAEEPRIDRVRSFLEEGVGERERVCADGSARRSMEGRAMGFSNRINALSLRLTQLPQFKSRQDDVFKVLGGVGG